MSQKNERLAFVVAFFLLVSLYVISQNIPLTTYPVPTSTSVPVEFQDRSFLTGEPCEAPCWYGLVPGISRQDEALALLSSLHFIKTTSFTETSIGSYNNSTSRQESWTRFSADCIYPEATTCVSLDFYQDRLRRVWLILNYSLSAGEVVSSLGAPDWIEAFPDGGAHQARWFVCHISMIWAEQKIVASYTETNRDKALEVCFDILPAGGPLDPDSPVAYLSYVDFFLRTEDIEGSGANWYPWPGFADD